MGFKKVKYEDHVTIITAENMNAIQDEIIQLSEEISDLKENAPTVEDVLNALPTWQGGAY